MKKQRLDAAKKPSSKRAALHTITNDNLKKRKKSRKEDVGKDAAQPAKDPVFAGGFLCEMIVPCQPEVAGNGEEINFASIKAVKHGEGQGVPSNVTIRGKDASHTKREARVRYFLRSSMFLLCWTCSKGASSWPASGIRCTLSRGCLAHTHAFMFSCAATRSLS